MAHIMGTEWTTDRVLQLAPDPASAKAGQGLAQPRKWVSLGRDERAVWGECQGSGAKPYQVQFDLAEGGSKCSCPSRKFPCKHVIGLMLSFATDPSKLATKPPPQWAEEWLASRAEKAKKKQEKAEAPPKPVDEAAAAKRREKRLAAVGDGLAALKVWSEDLVRGGVINLPAKGEAAFDEPARRMVDAQAPGAAWRIRKMADLTATGAGWQEPFVGQLASLHLLATAYERLDALPPATAEDVLATLGVPSRADENSIPPTKDVWQIIGREVDYDGQLRIQRTWLFGRSTGRPAMVLAFAHGTAPLDMSLVPSLCFEGEIRFYPGNGPRAAVVSRGELKGMDRPVGFATFDAMCEAAGGCFAAQPWLGEVAVPVNDVACLRTGDAWALVDAERKTLPVKMNDTSGWLTLAVTGGRPADLIATYDGRTLRPLAVMAGGEYVPLASRDEQAA